MYGPRVIGDILHEFVATAPITAGSGWRLVPYTSDGGSVVLVAAPIAGLLEIGRKLNWLGSLQNDTLLAVNCGSELIHDALVVIVPRVPQVYVVFAPLNLLKNVLMFVLDALGNGSMMLF